MIPTYPESCISNIHARRLQGLQEHIDLLLLGVGTAVLTAAARTQRRQRLRGQHLQQHQKGSQIPEPRTELLNYTLNCCQTAALSAVTAEEIPKYSDKTET